VIQKLALSFFALLVGLMVVVTTAYSFGLGQVLQNIIMLAACAVSLLWLYFTWRGRVTVALIGTIVTLVVGVFIVPLFSR
jgi:uncharacterized membrane protein YjjP (DUF1212 family)